jgi:hypothetical protein
MSKSILSIVASLEQVSARHSPPAGGKVSAVNPELAKLRGDERLETAYALKWVCGWRIADIAAAFGVSERTVFRWHKAYIEMCRAQLEGEPAINLIVELLLFLDEIIRSCLREAWPIRSDGAPAVDPLTGEKVVSKGTVRAKIALINMVLKIQQMRIDLLLKTGILPKEPGRLYTKLKDEKPVETDEETPERSS